MKNKKREKINLFCSVFNQHINNADKRALKLMKEFYPLQYRQILEFRQEGIMKIFDCGATIATAVYVALVTAFVNEY